MTTLLCVVLTLAACSRNQTVAVESTAVAPATIDHSTMDHSTMDHSTMHHAAPPASADVDPAATLSPDDFDAPAASAVEEAQKAAGDPHAGHAMPPAKKEQR